LGDRDFTNWISSLSLYANLSLTQANHVSYLGFQ